MADHTYSRVVVLAGDVSTTPVVVHALTRMGHIVTRVIIEEKESRAVFLRRRIKRQGIITVLGQILFSLCVVPILSRAARGRIDELYRTYDLDAAPVAASVLAHVPSVNSSAAMRTLQETEPDLVVLHGTRIVAERTIRAVSAPFVNIHAGMTPMYRGVHGGYWALADGHPDLCGVTVHLVDAGIDTGGILARVPLTPTGDDSFVTYPVLQLGEGLRALGTVLARSELVPETLPAPFSKLWYHPTLWGYLWTLLTKRVS